MRKSILFLLLPVLTWAQPTVAPTNEPIGSPRGENAGGYNILNSFETGYRWRAVDGNLGKYRSDVNFGNGIRLLGSQFRVNSREGQGRYFDELLLSTQGIGADPYQFANLRLEKNRLYRYEMLWRQNEYFNPALTVSFGQHRMDTSRTFQDHDFTLLPQSAIKFFVGYTRNSQSGPALATMQLFESRGDEFVLFQDVQRRRNEFRLGTEVSLGAYKLNVLHTWDRFEEDSPVNFGSDTAGNNITDATTLQSFRRTEPYQGNSPYWRIVLFRNTKRFSMNARYVNVSGNRDFLFDETAIGTDRFGGARNRQVLVAGSGRRPVVSGSLNLALTPNDRLTVTNQTAFHNTRIDGDATYRELNNAAGSGSIRDFRFLGIRNITNLSDVTYAVAKPLSLYGGYHFSNRRIISVEGQTFSDFTDSLRYEQTNTVHSGLAGLRLRPVKPLTLQLDGEIGRADRPFFTISDRNYHAFNARARYRARELTVSALARTFYNTNSTSLFAHSARSRQCSFDVSWSRSAAFGIDAGYSKLHLDTATGLAYFAGGRLIDSDRSLYVSNLHSGHLGIRTALWKRVDLYAGYSIVKDVGDGRPNPNTITTVVPAFTVAQTFPVSFQSPQARVSLRLRDNLRFNVGYQFYGYREDFFQLTYQNYRAHTGYSSLLWSF